MHLCLIKHCVNQVELCEMCLTENCVNVFNWAVSAFKGTFFDIMKICLNKFL